MNRNIVISGTDPTNPKTAGEIVDRLQQMQATLDAMHTEAGRLEVYAGSIIRNVLHYYQSMPDKRAALIARDVAAAVKSFRADVEALHEKAGRTASAVADCGVNLRGKFEWRPSR